MSDTQNMSDAKQTPESVKKFNKEVAKLIKNASEDDIVEIISSKEAVVNAMDNVNENNS